MNISIAESITTTHAPAPARRKNISIVTPCYNEEMNLRECADAVRNLFETQLTDYDFEHIFCDNCSTDTSPAELRQLAAEDSRVKVILNARNFGVFRSSFNALMSATGDAVVVMLAADLQDPPEVIADFVRRWEEGYEVVYGIRADREEGLAMRTARHIYYHTVRSVADINIPTDVGEFQLVDKKIIEALRQFDDYYPYIRGMIASCGFRMIGIPYRWKARKKGFSKNRIFHLVDQGLNGLISFTNLPMRLCMFCGCITSALSIVYAVITLTMHIVAQRPLASAGIATLLVAQFFFAGVGLFFLGIMGEYISAIHAQVRHRPLVIERERLNFAATESSAKQHEPARANVKAA